MAKSVEEMRKELAFMYAAGKTLAEIEDFIAHEAMQGGDAGLVQSMYLSVHNPSEWLEDFVGENLPPVSW
jgi:hypothetical protein